MMSLIQLLILPEIMLLLVEYVDYEEQVEWMSCCKEWYNRLLRGCIRKVSFSGTLSQARTFPQISVLVKNPSDQLSFIAEDEDESLLTGVNPLLAELGYCLKEWTVSFWK